MLKARLTRAQPRALLLAIGILAVTAASASAATINSPSTGSWSVIGTTGNDTITQSSTTATANDIIIGLGGNDSITVGNGTNLIEADGKCPAGDQDTVTPAPGDSVYCSLDQITTSHTDTITAGNGSNIILGGGYKNTIKAGNGSNAIYGGGVNSNTITVGSGSNLIVCGSGTNSVTTGNGTELIYCDNGSASTISVGSGTSTIFAQNGQKDTITCAKGNNATVYADPQDKVTGCKTVITKNAPFGQASPPPPGTSSKAAIRRYDTAKAHAAKKHHKSNKHSGKRH
ncbi:MAG TPA: calcium-binding protein [Solirubrobacteraceae bacterium]|nr:calcium-binding protein [Solirubrobacteraceae bacterium]